MSKWFSRSWFWVALAYIVVALLTSTGALMWLDTRS